MPDPNNWWQNWNPGGGIGNTFTNYQPQPSAPDPNDPNNVKNQARQQLNVQALGAGQFANQAQNNYNNMTGQLGATSNYLGGVMRGQNSVSAEQLRQGLQQNLAAQQSIAAGASPANASMAARTAAIQAGRLGAGLAGQQAIAGIQERNAAAGQLGQLQIGERGQDVNAALGARGQAIQGYGNILNGSQDQNFWDRYGPMLAGVGMAAASDRDLKTDIADADETTKKTMAGLKAYTFKYKDKRDGDGEQLGVMAQDLEKAGLKHAVIDTPRGKMVHGAKLSTANTAMIAALGRRVLELEKGSSK